MKSTLYAKHTALVALVVMLLVTSYPLHPQMLQAATTNRVIFDVTTDKSMYSPDAIVELRIDLKNSIGSTNSRQASGAVNRPYDERTTEFEQQ